MSKNIDLLLERRRMEMRKEIKIVIVDKPGDVTDTFMRLLKSVSLAGSRETIQKRKSEIISVVLECTKALLE